MATDLTLDLPDSNPIAVNQIAVDELERLRTFHNKETAAKCFLILRALATDERMKSVWHKLENRKRENYRSSDAYLLPAKFFPEFASRRKIDPQDRIGYQQEMMSGLFFGAYILASLPLVVKKRPAIQKPIALMSCREAARYEAIDIDTSSEDAHLLEAGVQDKQIIELVRDGKRNLMMGFFHVIVCRDEVVLMTSRNTVRDPRARCVGIGVAAFCQEFFGSALYGITSKITSVATGGTVQLPHIRQWVSEIRPVNAAEMEANQ